MIPINRIWPKGEENEQGIVHKPPDIEYTVSGSKQLIFYTQGILKGIHGVLETKDQNITILKHGYTVEQLNNMISYYSKEKHSQLIDSYIKIENRNDYISITSNIYYLLDDNLRMSLGFDNNILYTHIGSNILNSSLNIENQILEVHCNIIEKHISNHKIERYSHREDDLLCVIKYDANGLFISKEIKYIPLNVMTNNNIKLSISNQDEIKICKDFVAYLILKKP